MDRKRAELVKAFWLGGLVLAVPTPQTQTAAEYLLFLYQTLRDPESRPGIQRNPPF